MVTLIFNKGPTTAYRYGTVYTLRQISGRWRLMSRAGSLYTPAGTYKFVVSVGGELRVSCLGEHIVISGGAPVEYAGQMRFARGKSERGTLLFWGNDSGHYKSSASLAHQTGLPMNLFAPVMFSKS